MGLENPNVVIPDDLSPGQVLNFLEEAEEAIQACDDLEPEMKGYILQLLQHLQEFSRDSIVFIKDMDTEISKLSFANAASKLLLRHELKRYLSVPSKEGTKILDRAHRALDARPPDPPPAEQRHSTGRAAVIGEHVAEEPFI